MLKRGAADRLLSLLKEDTRWPRRSACWDAGSLLWAGLRDAAGEVRPAPLLGRASSPARGLWAPEPEPRVGLTPAGLVAEEKPEASAREEMGTEGHGGLSKAFVSTDGALGRSRPRLPAGLGPAAGLFSRTREMIGTLGANICLPGDVSTPCNPLVLEADALFVWLESH